LLYILMKNRSLHLHGQVHSVSFTSTARHLHGQVHSVSFTSMARHLHDQVLSVSFTSTTRHLHGQVLSVSFTSTKYGHTGAGEWFDPDLALRGVWCSSSSLRSDMTLVTVTGAG